MAKMWDQERAYRIRKRLREGKPVDDVARRWFDRYEATRQRRGRPGERADVLARIRDEVCRRMAVTVEDLRQRPKGTGQLQEARAVFAVAAREAGFAFQDIADALARNLANVAKAIAKNRQRTAVANAAREIVELVMHGKAPVRLPTPTAPLRPGDVVTLTIVVGSRLWNAIDRAEEMLALSDGAIGHRAAADLRSHAFGSE